MSRLKQSARKKEKYRKSGSPWLSKRGYRILVKNVRKIRAYALSPERIALVAEIQRIDEEMEKRLTTQMLR